MTVLERFLWSSREEQDPHSYKKEKGGEELLQSLMECRVERGDLTVKGGDLGVQCVVCDKGEERVSKRDEDQPSSGRKEEWKGTYL